MLARLKRSIKGKRKKTGEGEESLGRELTDERNETTVLGESDSTGETGESGKLTQVIQCEMCELCGFQCKPILHPGSFL